MFDSFIQFLSPLNIDDNHLKIIVALSSLSFVVSFVNFVLKKCNIFDADEVINLFVGSVFKNPNKRFNITALVFVLDLGVLIFNLCNLFFTIPSDFEPLWIIVTIVSYIFTCASAGSKLPLASFWFGYSLGMLVNLKFSKAFRLLGISVWMAFSAIVSVCDSMLNYNDVITIIKSFKM